MKEIADIETCGSDFATGNSFMVNLKNNTFAITGGSSLVVDANTRIIKAETTQNNVPGDNQAEEIGAIVYDSFEPVQWYSLAMNNGTVDKPAMVFQVNGKARYIILTDPGIPLAHSEEFGVIRGFTTFEGDMSLYIGYNGKIQNIVGTISGASKGDVVKFTLDVNGEIDTGSVQLCQQVSSGYSNYKIVGLNTSNREIKIAPVNADFSDVLGANTYTILYDKTNTKVWDTSPLTGTPTLTDFSALTEAQYVQVYDVFDQNGFARADGIYDFIMVVKK